MIKLFLFATSMLLYCDVIAQTPNPYSLQIREQANKMVKLMLDKKYSEFIVYTVPEILQLGGGKQKMIDVLKKGEVEIAAGGFKILGSRFGEPGPVIDTANTLQCILPETNFIQTPKGILISQSSLFGVSRDKGKTWKFTEYNTENMYKVRPYLPFISKRLVPVTTKRVLSGE